MKLRSEQGFSLVELLLVMAIFIVVIVLASQAFERMIGTSSQEGKKAESNIQGVVGLELMRTDIEHAGYGLPWILSTVANWPEMDVAANWPADGIDSNSFNDTVLSATIDANKVPRAYQNGISSTTGIGYLVVKSTIAGFSSTAKRWAYVQYSGSNGANSYIKKWNNTDDLASNDVVITLNSATRGLITNSGNFSYQLSGTNSNGNFLASSGFGPAFSTDVYLTYGVATTGLSMPYNRADYYVKRPSTGMSQSCAPGTGNLYKGVVNHNGGGVSTYPLLDCVADMQIVYSLDTNGDSAIDLHTTDISQLSAQSIRSQVKEVRVYILTHEGKADRNFTYPSSTIDVGESIWGSFYGRHFDLTSLQGIGTNWKNYRWKVYKMVVIPKNLSS